MHYQSMPSKPRKAKRRKRKSLPGCRPYIAIALMIRLARTPDQTVGAIELATGLGLGPSFMEKLIADLREAGLIESFRGPTGGFRLAKAASAISALDIFQ